MSYLITKAGISSSSNPGLGVSDLTVNRRPLPPSLILLALPITVVSNFGEFSLLLISVMSCFTFINGTRGNEC